MHLRGGDACADNRRPTVCVTFEQALSTLALYGITEGTIMLATDDSTVAQQASAYGGTSFHVVLVGIDRVKLKSDTFVELREELDRASLFEELWLEMGFLLQADVLLGSFYSNFARLALQLSTAALYIPLDSLWCPYCLCQLNMPPQKKAKYEYDSPEWVAKMRLGLEGEIEREDHFASEEPFVRFAVDQLAFAADAGGC